MKDYSAAGVYDHITINKDVVIKLHILCIRNNKTFQRIIITYIPSKRDITIGAEYQSVITKVVITIK